MAAFENIFELETDVFGHGSVKLNGRDLSMEVSGVDIHIEAGVVTDVMLHVTPDKFIGRIPVKDFHTYRSGESAKSFSEVVKECFQQEADS